VRFSRRRVTHHHFYPGRIRLTASAEVALPHFCFYRGRIAASAEGVGALLAGDLARSGSKPGASVDQTNLALRPHDRFALNRRQAGLLRPAGRINSHREQAPSHTDGFAASASMEVASALPLLSRSCCRIAASAEGVGALLAGDLARSGSKPGASTDQTNTALSPHDRFALNRRQAGLLRPPGRINSHRVRSAAFGGARRLASGSRHKKGGHREMAAFSFSTSSR